MNTGCTTTRLNQFLEDPSLEIGQVPAAAPLRDLLAAWSAWPKRGQLSPRSAFDPVDFPRLLPWIGLVEFDANPNSYRPYDALFRYVGSARAELFGTTGMTGRHISSLADGSVERWFSVYDRLIARREPVIVRGKPYMVGKAFMRFEMLMLPLCRNDDAEGKEIGFILSCAQIEPAD